MAVETITPGHHVPEHAWEHTALRTELLLALGAVVLSILGLARVFPMYLTAISIIALGAVLLFQGATTTTPFAPGGTASAPSSVTAPQGIRTSTGDSKCPWYRPALSG